MTTSADSRPTSDAEATATPAKSRIRVLDFIRGIAILGMLIPNIPWHLGDSMSRLPEATGPGVAAWLMQYLIFDQRFMPLFAMLFGTGMFILVERRSGPGLARYITVRTTLLLGIGVAHAYLLWPGDILITYAVCTPFLLAASRLPLGRLIALALALKAVSLAFAEWPDLYFSTLEQWLFGWWLEVGPAPSTIQEAYAGSYADLFAYNAWRNISIQWTALPYFRIWNALAFMLAGVALYRTGVMQGERDARFYRRLIAGALLLGGPFVLYGVLARIGINATVGPTLGFTNELPLRNVTFAIGCAVTSFAVLGACHLVHRRFDGALVRAVEATGRMALTNYLLQTVVFFVAVHTLRVLPFDQLGHDAFALLALGMVVVHLTLSPLWLSRFRQGPIEALWRRTADALGEVPTTGTTSQ